MEVAADAALLAFADLENFPFEALALLLHGGERAVLLDGGNGALDHAGQKFEQRGVLHHVVEGALFHHVDGDFFVALAGDDEER